MPFASTSGLELVTSRLSVESSTKRNTCDTQNIIPLISSCSIFVTCSLSCGSNESEGAHSQGVDGTIKQILVHKFCHVEIPLSLVYGWISAMVFYLRLQNLPIKKH